MSFDLIRVSRPILKPDHQKLRAHIPESNRLGELSIKWRRLGETGVTLLERGEYQREAAKDGSKLSRLGTPFVKASIEGALSLIEGARARITVPVSNVDFMGDGPYLSIAYILDTTQPGLERVGLTQHVDYLSGTAGEWRDFEPHITVATVPADNAAERILDAFWGFAPHDITLLSTEVTAL